MGICSLEGANFVAWASMTLGILFYFLGTGAGFLAFRDNNPAISLTSPGMILSYVMLLLYGGLRLVRLGALERRRVRSVVTIGLYILFLVTFVGAHRTW